ncbi:MAG: gliding motility-associated C-terminal domain-containing protein [Bacteroidetes bacterium]|nr:gliding motility-associated C-terminal domain-containing protein [Bacteroidota bacterium]MBU1718088.1 gliding motility-associated C-terminal domain-containing protein [Bacteroidota bacterium]
MNFFDQSMNAATWQWIINCCGTDSLTEQNPTVIFQDTGSYDITLVVYSVDGCVDSVTQTVVVWPDVNIFIPNAFTPGITDYNEEWRCFGTYIDESTFEVVVFDRWGEVIFESNDMNEGWNGKYRNAGSEYCPGGVYPYVVSFRSGAGKEYKYIGHINLVR